MDGSAKVGRHVAGVDTCANVYVFRDKRFFNHLREHSGDISETSATTKVAGKRIARFKFNHKNSPEMCVEAFYIPNARFNLLPNKKRLQPRSPTRSLPTETKNLL